MRKISAVLAVIFMITYICLPAICLPAVTIYGQEKQDGYVYDYLELQEWLDANFQSGETVFFGDTITIPDDIMFLDINGVTLNTGSYGLVICSNSVIISEAEIIGVGAEIPVVTIANDASIFLSGMDTKITATGANSGGCAVQIESNGDFIISNQGWCTVQSKGNNAVGIYAEGNVELQCTTIRSDGIGLHAEGDAELFLCDIDAPVPLTAGGEAVLDTCFVSESVDGAEVTNRKITEISKRMEKDLFHVLPLGNPASWTNLGENASLTVLLGDREQDILVSWDTSGVNTDKLGEYKIPGEILPPYHRLGLDDDFPLVAKAEIVDVRIPYFLDAFLIFPLEGEPILVVSLLWETDDPRNAQIMRSDDDGENWRDISDTQEWEDFFYGGGNLALRLPMSELNDPILLKIITEDAGESRVICLSSNENDEIDLEYVGGDRNGGDRGENELLDAVPPPKPMPKPKSSIEETSITVISTPASILSEDTSMMENTTETTETGEATQTMLENSPLTKPSIDMTHSPQSAPVLTVSTDVPAEFSDHTSITVSGERLAVMMAANPKYVSFLKGELRASILTSFLEDLNISSLDSFTVILYKPDEASFWVSFNINGNDLATPFTEPFFVSLIWSGGAISCVDKDGKSTDAIINAAENRATFFLYESGKYHLTAQAAEAVSMIKYTNDTTNFATSSKAEAPSPKPYANIFMPLILVTLISLAGATIYFIFTHKRRAGSS